ncbi:uncharacterized protein LOC119324426 isoform X1 [Triticum dicoccoides]|uniref:uncharacterized protein LOC119324426 isoform X1 n=1 Tax=Triticum dicoccoides TaxID=85692 RepID=UPI00188EFEF7|nr:uncharacterized protein LOC119324426 isoform X1 [Triticum dicoccoides]
MPPPPSLPDGIVEDIFLRLPPDEPACLVRASLASKLWLGHLTGPRFRGRYRELHGAPPMLGFLYDWFWDYVPEEKDAVPRFVSTTGFGARVPPDHHWGDSGSDYNALDCRHGRVLLGDYGAPIPLVVWDPMTGRQTKMEAPKGQDIGSGAAVLCAVTGCDHRACHQGAFRVVVFGSMTTHVYHPVTIIQVCVSSPETGEWSQPCPGLDLGVDAFIMPVPPVVIRDAVYLMHARGEHDHIAGILKYDLGSNCLSLIDMPLPGAVNVGDVILMAMEDGSLGLAHASGSTLYLWSSSSKMGVATWTQRRAIDLKSLLPIQNPMEGLRLIGSMEGSDIIFVLTDLGIYQINLNSLQWNKIWKRQKFFALIPYMSFHNPQERMTP